MGLGPMDGRLLVKRVARLAPLSRLRLGFVGGLDGVSHVSRLSSHVHAPVPASPAAGPSRGWEGG